MKKVKIMLMSALVVATVGGALAFKAKNFSTGFKCGTTTNSCPNTPAVNMTTVGASSSNFVSYCTNSGSTSSGCTYAIAE